MYAIIFIVEVFSVEKNKKKESIIFYFIKMIILFNVVLVLQQIYAGAGVKALSTSKFGSEALFEIIWSGLVLIVILLFKNKYIFTQKREKYFSSFQYILPEIILSFIFLIFSIISLIANGNPVDFRAIANLGVYCLFIGIVEEFLCRGWLLNEFLERYSDSKKEIILSILFSSFIFGVIHFFNIGENQGVAETLVQVMNAAASGVFLALVYYKTKNIWVVVTSHAFWDFSLFLSEVNSLGDCLSGAPTQAIILGNIIRGIVLTGAYLCLCYWLYVKTDLYNKEVKVFHRMLLPAGIITYMVGLLFINLSTENYYTCPEYGMKKIDDSYRVSFYNYKDYSVPKYGISLKTEDNNIILHDNSNEYSVVLSDEYYDYLLVDNDDRYSILIQVGNNSVLYGSYLKSEIILDKDYLEKVKNDLNLYVVTEIGKLGTLSIKNSEYKYPIIQSNIGEYLYFDKDNKLYIDK